MKDIMTRAQEISGEIIENRRYMHQNPEIEMELPKTTKYVMNKLREMGYEPEEICESGIVATVGIPGKTVLLRADMDALPMREETDLPFKSQNGYAHTCGHDMHTAMLLGAAKIIKEKEHELKGTIKLMFQPGEENVVGAKIMIDAGVLDNPKVDVAMAMHMECVDVRAGVIMYKTGKLYSSVDRFRITVKGKGGHGAAPDKGIDPINVAVHIYLGLQEIISREISPFDNVVLTIGAFNSGSVGNIIPETAVMEGSLRTYSDDVRVFVKKRIVEIGELTARKFRAECNVNYTSGVPAVINDENLTVEMLEYAKEIVGEKVYKRHSIMSSEDFSLISEKIPSVYFGLGGGSKEEGYMYRGHNPKIIFNEEALPVGAAIYANCAIRWLEKNSIINP